MCVCASARVSAYACAAVCVCALVCMCGVSAGEDGMGGGLHGRRRVIISTFRRKQEPVSMRQRLNSGERECEGVRVCERERERSLSPIRDEPTTP